MKKTHIFHKRKICILALVLGAAAVISGCSRLAALEKGIQQTEVSFSTGQIMTVAATERNRYQNLLTDQIWRQEDGEGRTFEARMMSQLARFFTELGTMGLLADQHQIELTGRERESLTQLSQEYYGQLTQGDIRYMGASQEEIYDLYSQYYRAEKLVSELTSAENLEVSDAEAKVIRVQQIVVEDREQAQELLEQVQGENSDFQSVSRTYSPEGQSEISMVRTEQPDALEEAAFSLEQDQISGIVEQDGLYYILKCTNSYDEKATEARKVVLAREKRNQAFQQIYDAFTQECQVVLDPSPWEQVTLEGGEDCVSSNFFDLYRAYFPQ